MSRALTTERLASIANRHKFLDLPAHAFEGWTDQQRAEAIRACDRADAAGDWREWAIEQQNSVEASCLFENLRKHQPTDTPEGRCCALAVFFAHRGRIEEAAEAAMLYAFEVGIRWGVRCRDAEAARAPITAGRAAADERYDQPGGYRERKRIVQARYRSGEFPGLSKEKVADSLAEEPDIGVSRKTIRRWLENINAAPAVPHSEGSTERLG